MTPRVPEPWFNATRLTPGITLDIKDNIQCCLVIILASGTDAGRRLGCQYISTDGAYR